MNRTNIHQTIGLGSLRMIIDIIRSMNICVSGSHANVSVIPYLNQSYLKCDGICYRATIIDLPHNHKPCFVLNRDKFLM